MSPSGRSYRIFRHQSRYRMDPTRAQQARTSGPDLKPLDRPSEPKRSRKPWRWLTVMVLIAIGAAVLVTTGRLIGTASPQTELPLAGRLALLPFVDATGDRSGGWIEAGLMEMVAETVSRTVAGALVSPARLRKDFEHRGFDLSDPGDRDRARRLAIAAGADQVLDATVVRQRRDEHAIELELFDRQRPCQPWSDREPRPDGGGRRAGVLPRPRAQP